MGNEKFPSDLQDPAGLHHHPCGSHELGEQLQVCISYISGQADAIVRSPQIVAMASIASFQLAFILLVFIVMACASSHRWKAFPSHVLRHLLSINFSFEDQAKACFTYRPLFYDYIATGGKDDVQLRKVKINMARRVEEGEVEAKPRNLSAERMGAKMEALLWKKEEQLLAALVAAEQGVSAEDGVTVETPTAPTESQGIYPVLGSPTSPV